MDQLGDLLKNYDYTKPRDEVELIKDYVRDQFNARVRVYSQPKRLVIIAPNASLASSLRMMQVALIEACNIKKQLVIRIG